MSSSPNQNRLFSNYLHVDTFTISIIKYNNDVLRERDSLRNRTVTECRISSPSGCCLLKSAVILKAGRVTEGQCNEYMQKGKMSGLQQALLHGGHDGQRFQTSAA